MYLTDYREYSLKDVITQLEPGLFKRVTGLDVKDFELLVSLGLFNGPLMNDAVYKFKRYEDSSLSYTGINKHEGEKVGGFDTVLTQEEYRKLYGDQQSSLQANISNKKTTIVISSQTNMSNQGTPNKTVQIKENDTRLIDTVIDEKIISNSNHEEVIVGEIVTHKTFGLGQVKAIVDDKIIVAFGNSEKMFMYPAAFKMGYLTKKK